LVSHLELSHRIARLALSSDIIPVDFRMVYIGLHLTALTSFSTFSIRALSSFEKVNFLPASQR